jgi:fused signal recognition particle receptor
LSFSLARLTQGLKKTQTNWVARVREAVGHKQKLDAHTLEHLEEALLAGDVGLDVSEGVVRSLKDDFAKINGPEEALQHLKTRLAERLASNGHPAAGKPQVILLLGVNGTGKTTTAGKLAARFISGGERVLLAGCDTFRAAASEQLQTWAQRSGADLVIGRPDGDPAAVAFDATQAAVARGVDRLIIDTAGRLHTKDNLMAELQKIARVIQKVIPGAPHEVWLVLDSSTGQNGLRQAQEFNRSVPLSGVVLTKMDGTARGGIIFAIHETLGVPVKYVGLGEAIEDLDTFEPGDFVEALFAEPVGSKTS